MKGTTLHVVASTLDVAYHDSTVTGSESSLCLVMHGPVGSHGPGMHRRGCLTHLTEAVQTP